MSKAVEQMGMYFSLGVAALVVLYILKSTYGDCVRCFRRPASAASPVVVRGGPRAARRSTSTVPVPCVAEYWRSDGWRQATRPVCLCDFADGEVVRVLLTCMHYFHAACVGEWLRKGHATCPLCRAAQPSAAGSPEYVISTDQLELS